MSVYDWIEKAQHIYNIEIQQKLGNDQDHKISPGKLFITELL